MLSVLSILYSFVVIWAGKNSHLVSNAKSFPHITAYSPNLVRKFFLRLKYKGNFYTSKRIIFFHCLAFFSLFYWGIKQILCCYKKSFVRTKNSIIVVVDSGVSQNHRRLGISSCSVARNRCFTYIICATRENKNTCSCFYCFEMKSDDGCGCYVVCFHFTVYK